MKNIFFKTLFLFIGVFIAFISNVNAQLYCPPPSGEMDMFRNRHITLGAGPTFLYGDIATNDQVGFGFQGKYDYKVYKGVLLGAEFQLGNLKAKGDSTDMGGSHEPRYVRNFYKVAAFNLSIFPFHFFSDNIWGRNETIAQRLMHGFYAGVGLGMAFNDYKEVMRIDGNPATRGDEAEQVPKLDTDGDPVFDTDEKQVFVDSYKKKTSSLLAPIANIGIVLPVTSTDYMKKAVWSIVANAQFSFSRDDKLDGYDPDPMLIDNTSNDSYSIYTLGVRYSF